MADIDYRYRNGQGPAPQLPQPDAKPVARPGWTREWWFRLLALLFFSELIVPFILWQAGLPRSTDFVKEIFAGFIVLMTFAFILLRDRIPMALLLVFAVTLIWGLTALLDGQSASATVWGWWRFFKYPLLLLFAYLIPRWPSDFPRILIKFLILLLAFEVAVQLVQFAMGQPPGDSLAGTFGWKGVGQYTMFVFFTVCIGLGHWVATGEWKSLLAILVLGLAGSMLNVTKFYLIGVVVLGVAALALHLVRGGKFRQLFIYVVLFSLAAAIFLPVYNSFIANTRGLKPLQEYLTAESIESYLFNDGSGATDGQYNLGRGLAVTYAWQQIQRDNTTLLFGYGLGSRTYSTALGVTGRSLEEDLYGGAGDTGLGIWIQEFGLVGLALFLILNIWIAHKLFVHARKTSDPHLAALEYGLILFTLFWPMWLWYHKPWISGVMMILYWITLGYTFRRINDRPRRGIRRASLPQQRFQTQSQLGRSNTD